MMGIATKSDKCPISPLHPSYDQRLAVVIPLNASFCSPIVVWAM
jgi:hypothetical protein